MTITRWFHDKAPGGVEAVAYQIQQVWVALGVYAAAKELLMPVVPVRNSQISNLSMNWEVDHGLLSHSKDCK